MSAGSSIVAVHRTNHPTSCPADPSTFSCDPNLSFAAIHHDAEGLDVSMNERVDLNPRHVIAFTDCPPRYIFTVVVRPLIMPELVILGSSS